MSKWEIISLALSCESAARIYESNWCVVGQLEDLANISSLAELIVKSPVLLITMRAVHQIKEVQDPLTCCGWGAYSAIAARKLGRCGIGLLILPETLGDAGFVMM
jgi:hypothetical protein